MFFKIQRCYDSHLHLLATGQVAETLNLSGLKSESDVENLLISDHHFCGEWLLGFGWNQNSWKINQFPIAQTLDQYFPNHPVAFTRADGHALWVNSAALRLANIQSSGVLIDDQMKPILKLIPAYSREQKKKFILSGIQILNVAGFTHIRDMAGDEEQWQILTELDRLNLLTAYIEQNIFLDDFSKLNEVIRFAKWAKENQSKHLRFAAIKFFYDGALGSEGALLSQNYIGKNQSGFRLSDTQQIEDLIRQCWKNKLPVAIHVIGDLAVHEVAEAANKVWESGLQGELNLEHVEIAQPKTISILKKLNVITHMQPSHFLSDHLWLKEKIGSLFQYTFPWAELNKNNIPVYWGSDSPIEKPNVFQTLKALDESPKYGIPIYPLDLLDPHSHPDEQWGGQCMSIFENNKVKSVQFDGKELFKIGTLET